MEARAYSFKLYVASLAPTQVERKTTWARYQWSAHDTATRAHVVTLLVGRSNSSMEDKSTMRWLTQEAGWHGALRWGVSKKNDIGNSGIKNLAADRNRFIDSRRDVIFVTDIAMDLKSTYTVKTTSNTTRPLPSASGKRSLEYSPT